MTGTVAFSTTCADQAGATARDDQIDEAAGAQQVADARAVGTRHGLHGVARQAGLLGGAGQHLDQRDVGVLRRCRPAQQRGVAALEGQAGGVDGDVRTRLVDHRDHPEGHPHLPDLEPVGPVVAAHDLADRIGQRRDVAQPVRHGGHSAGIEPQPVDQTVRETGVATGGDVAPIGNRERRRSRHRARQPSRAAQRPWPAGVERGELGRRLPCPRRQRHAPRARTPRSRPPDRSSREITCRWDTSSRVTCSGGDAAGGSAAGAEHLRPRR